MKSKKNYLREKIIVFGHNGLIGSAVLKELEKRKYSSIITINKTNLDLLDSKKVINFFKRHKPKKIIIAAARVGGIYANKTYPFNFLYENLVIQNNIIAAAIKFTCKKIIFLGSSCIYPKKWTKPFKEEDLQLTSLEKSNEPYAIAKIAGLKLCETFNKQFNKKNIFFLTLIPPNLFGENDNYNKKNSHVLAALIRKFYEAKKNNSKNIIIWGTGKPKREFMLSEDAAKVIIDFLELNFKKIQKITRGEYYHINIGVNKDFSIEKIVKKLVKISNYKGKITFDKKYPDGVKRKLLDISLFKSLLPITFRNIKYDDKSFENKLSKIYSSIDKSTFKNFEKKSSYNLPF